MVSRSYEQDPPFAVQIELVEGCNLRCSFCGLSGIRDPKNHNFKFMDARTLYSTLEQITEAGWNPRVEFAMHGEPTMHPDFVGMIATARAAAPGLQLMMTSNAGGLVRKPGAAANVDALFAAGLNVLALDDYEGVNYVAKVREAVDAMTEATVAFEVREYPEDPKASPHARRRLSERVLIYVQAIDTATKGNHSLLNNHAGAGAPPSDVAHGQRCAKPFREMSIRWDGNVAVCCNDWRGVYKCGNVLRDGVVGVWRGAAMEAARRKLIRGERDFAPCRGCDATSYRVGLLPDKFGKVKLPAPTAQDLAVIRKATSGAPYTAPVKREWE